MKLFAIVALCVGLQLNVSAQNIDVCATCEITTIAEAIEIASPNTIITVKAGRYYEHEIIINKPITIIGEEGAIVDGEEEGSTLRVQSDDVTIKGLTIENVGFSHTEEFAAIQVQKSKRFTISDNSLSHVFFGILIQASKDGVINNNRIIGDSAAEFYAGNGVHAWKSEGLLISNNFIEKLRDGIYLEFVNNSKVFDNISQYNIRYGLHFMFSNDDDYERNVFSENGAGVAVMFSKKIGVKNNVFKNNWGTASFGLLLKEIYDADIEGNVFQENTVGIQVEGSSRIYYKRNNFKSNGWAVKISGGCFANEFTENNFLYNSFDLSYNAKMNDNIFENNYWSDYTGYDLDNDGIGDVSYRPVKLFSYIVNRTPETIIMLRSLFVDIINFSEKVSPVFTPNDLEDPTPKMRMIND